MTTSVITGLSDLTLEQMRGSQLVITKHANVLEILMQMKILNMPNLWIFTTHKNLLKLNFFSFLNADRL